MTAGLSQMMSLNKSPKPAMHARGGGGSNLMVNTLVVLYAKELEKSS